MSFEMGPETRTVRASWDVSTYTYKMDGRGLTLLTQAMKDKKIKGIKCGNCGTVYVPGPTFCRKCYIDIDDVVEVQDTGEVMSYCVEMADVRGNPIEEPKISAMIKLDGADTWFTATVTGIDWHDMKVGLKVKTIWVEEPTGSLSDIDRFEPL